MKKVIVTTTINPPTKAIEKFQRLDGWDLVVIGDKKTPKDYSLTNGLYVSPEKQEALDKTLSDLIGWNCIQRRSFGLLMAHQMKADIVAVVDDDNIPLDGWGENLLLNGPVSAAEYQTDQPAFDPLGATNHSNLWHRGFPMQLVPERRYDQKKTVQISFDVQADLWNGDPDIDAVCRMIYKPECDFKADPFPFTSNQIGPFNSQNTFLKGACLKDYFLFPHIGRMDDIWASYYLQAKGKRTVYQKPSVYQERNPHDLVVDMKKEYIGYENNIRLLEALKSDPDRIREFLPENSWKAFEAYRRHFNG